MATGVSVLRGSLKTSMKIRIRGAALAALTSSVLIASCSGDDPDETKKHSGGSAGQAGSAGDGAGGDGMAGDAAAGTLGAAATGTAGTTPGAAGSDGTDGGTSSYSQGGVGAQAEGGVGAQAEGGVGNHSGGGIAGTSGGGVSGSSGYVCDPPCAGDQICCPSGVRNACGPIDGDGCKLPDLVVDDVAAQNSLDVQMVDATADPCLLDEACVSGPGLRRVLAFDTATSNIGAGDLAIGAPSLDNPDFEYSSCHDHFHFNGYATYDLLDGSGNVVAAGHKQSFCLRDDLRVMFDPSVRADPLFSCDSQGLSRGWSDVYYASLPCQWVDVTGVPAGDYILRIRINPAKRIIESNYDNNEILVPVTIPQ